MSDGPIPRDVGKPVPTPRKKAATAVPKPVVPAAKVPFRMSYDGTTTAEHVKYMIARGAR